MPTGLVRSWPLPLPFPIHMRLRPRWLTALPPGKKKEWGLVLSPTPRPRRAEDLLPENTFSQVVVTESDTVSKV
jgi:hypothetical protein